MRRFDVALWHRWPAFFSHWVDAVEAESAYGAIVQVMQGCGYTQAAHAVALAQDGSLQYRAFHITGVPLAVGDGGSEAVRLTKHPWELEAEGSVR